MNHDSYLTRILFTFFFFFFLNDPAPPEIHPLPQHAPLPIFGGGGTGNGLTKQKMTTDPPIREGSASFLVSYEGGPLPTGWHMLTVGKTLISVRMTAARPAV